MTDRNKKHRFRIRLLPVMAFTAVVLLLLKAHPYGMSLSAWPDIPINDDTVLWDVFCYIKSIAIFSISIWAFLTMFYLIITGQMKIKKTYFYIPMAVYTFFVLLSYFMSDYKFMAWQGCVDRFEGTRTILCYIFMLFYTINVVDDIWDIRFILFPTFVGIFIACLIGLTQFLGHDILVTPFFARLIAGDLEMAANFQPGEVYQTVYNMNYVGMYLALIIPALFYFIIKGFKDLKNKTEYELKMTKKTLMIFLGFGVLFLLLIIINVIGAASLGGFIGVIVAAGLFVCFSLEKKSHRILLFATGLLLFAAGLIFIYMRETNDRTQIDYFKTADDRIVASIDGNELHIVVNRENNEITLEDAAGKTIPVYCLPGEEGEYQVDDQDRFAGKISIIPQEINGEKYIVIYMLRWPHTEFAFKFTDDGAKYINDYGAEVSLDKVESIGFKKHGSAGSSRGYIWSRTLPLLKDYLFIGSGADTFMLVFPQNDYAGRYSEGCPTKNAYDKPHNMYLMMAVGTGLISCIAFISLVCMFFWQLMKKEKNDPVVLALAAGIGGFLVAGLFNDSSVCFMPIFYGLLGCCIAVIISEK